MSNLIPKLRLTHRFAAIIITFAILTAGGAAIFWHEVNDLRGVYADIIHRQYAARVAIVEAKASEANFTAFAYELAHADPDTAQQTTWAFRDEAKRFRNWIAITRAFLPEARDKLDKISARFDKLLAFLEGFARQTPSTETREFQIDYRFGPLRDDLEAALNEVSNGIAGDMNDRIAHVDNVAAPRFQRLSALFAGSYIFVFVLALIFASVAVARPLLRLAAAMREIAAGRFDTEIGYTRRTDELGEMARAIQVFRDKGQTLKLLEAETRTAETRAQRALAAERERFIEAFQEDVLHVIAALSRPRARNCSAMRRRCATLPMRPTAGRAASSNPRASASKWLMPCPARRGNSARWSMPPTRISSPPIRSLGGPRPMARRRRIRRANWPRRSKPSARSPISSAASLTRPICSPSTRRSRPRGAERPAVALLSSPERSKPSRKRPRVLPPILRRGSAACEARPSRSSRQWG